MRRLIDHRGNAIIWIVRSGTRGILLSGVGQFESDLPATSSYLKFLSLSIVFVVGIVQNLSD